MFDMSTDLKNGEFLTDAQKQRLREEVISPLATPEKLADVYGGDPGRMEADATSAAREWVMENLNMRADGHKLRHWPCI